MAPGILETIAMAEARSCRPDAYLQMQLKMSKSKSQKPVSEMTGNEDDTVANYDDDMSVISSKIVPVQNKMDRLLKRIKKSIEQHTNQERELQQCQKVHLDRAKGRYEVFNHKGAVLSMRSIKRLEAEQDRLLNAIGYLRHLEIDLEIPSEGAVDVPSFFITFEDDVKKMIEPPGDEIMPSDEELLFELASIVKED